MQGLLAQSAEVFHDLDCYNSALIPPELAPLNSFYGIGSVVRRYASLEMSQPLYCHWPHEVLNQPNGLCSYDLNCLPLTMAYCKFNLINQVSLNAIRHAPVKVAPSITPFSMALQSLKDDGSLEADRVPGAVYFLSKGTLNRSLSSRRELEAQIERNIERLRVRYNIVNACVFWKELKQGFWSTTLYKKFDNCFCAGTQMDPSFLLRSAKIIASHDTICASHFGSFAVYASIAKVKFEIINGPSVGDVGHYNIKERAQELSFYEEICTPEYIREKNDEARFLFSTLSGRKKYLFFKIENAWKNRRLSIN